jgi:hypothetical protein
MKRLDLTLKELKQDTGDTCVDEMEQFIPTKSKFNRFGYSITANGNEGGIRDNSYSIEEVE